MKKFLIVLMLFPCFLTAQVYDYTSIPKEMLVGGQQGVYQTVWYEPAELGTLKQYDKLELAVLFPDSKNQDIFNFLDGKSKKKNPFDPDVFDVFAVVKSPDSDQRRVDIRINGFYYEEFRKDTLGDFLNWDWNRDDKNSNFRIRFTPKEVGNYTIQIFISEEGESPIGLDKVQFEVKESDHPGFVKVGNTKRYFQFENGRTFFPSGGNLPPEFINESRWKSSEVHVRGSKWAVDPYDGEARLYHPLFYSKFLETLETYSKSGANYVRIIALPWTTDIEYESLNNYSKRMHIAWELDRMFETIGDLGMKVEYCIQAQYTLENPGYYGHFNWNWPTDSEGCKKGNNNGYCYQEELDLKDPIEFFTDENAQLNWKKKLRYIIARWGYCPDIAIFQLMSEVNGTGIVPNYILQEVKNDRGEVIYDQCLVKAGDDVIMKPYQDQEGYAEAVYKWHVEMASYIKNELGHKEHLIAPSYAGEPKANMGDSTFHSDVIDVCSYNLYTPGARAFFMLDQRAQKHRRSDYNYYVGENGNTLAGATEKPFVYSEIGIADYYNCDEDIGDIKMMLISPFTGVSGMGLNWDNSRLSRSENWYLYGNVSDFMDGIDLNNVFWTTKSDETSWDEIEYVGEMVCLQSLEKRKRAIGAVQNRSWNYYTKGKRNNTDDTCGEDFALGTGAKELNAFTTYKDLEYDSPFGPYPLKIENMGILKKYIIEWYDPFTLRVVKVQTRNSSIGGKLWLEYPKLSTDKGFSPIYWFKAYQVKSGEF